MLSSILYDQNWECCQIAVLYIAFELQRFNQFMFRDPIPATYIIATRSYNFSNGNCLAIRIDTLENEIN